MDSMRSLNRSLPTSPPKSQAARPPEQLLQAFRAAALSVTNLYKTAATGESSIRKQGYQDALDHLLAFLDKENIGLDDGEGWRIRQWATERLEGAPRGNAGSESDEDRAETEKRAEESSPVLVEKQLPEEVLPMEVRSSSPTRIESPQRDHSAPPPSLSNHRSTPFLTKPEMFSFRSSHKYPAEVEMQSSDTVSEASNGTDNTPAGSRVSPSHLRLEVVARASRASNRGSGHAHRHVTRLASARSLGTGAGSKRKIPFGEFFDISGIGEGKETTGLGSKKSRLG